MIDKMLRLENFYGTYKSKCRRNLRMYEWSPTISLESLTDDQCVGYYQAGMFDIESDTTSSVEENVIRSCIETLVSKIASQKVRPFFNTVNGTFRDMQVTKQAQDYFDCIYDEQNVNKIISDAFRDSCIFDRGVIYVDNNTHKIHRTMPWQVFIDPREASYNHLTQLAWKQSEFPISLLPIKVPEGTNDYITYWQYWDLNSKKHVYYIPELNHYEEEKWDCDALPFLFIHYTSPIKATTSQSVVDLLYGIQMEIDALLVKIKDASQLSSPLKYFVPDGSDIKVNKLSNRTGEVIKYVATPNMTGSPVTVATEPFMDPQWMQTIEALKEHAYEMVGISQLSATSQKPQGLDSGVALKTMESIESDRFETQLNNVVRTYVDLARLMIQIFSPDEDILSPNKFRGSIHWEDIVEMRDKMSIQFSAAESLSKDPSTKLQQLQQLYAAGLIPQSRIVQLLQLPDLQLGYSITNNSINAVLAVIDDCLENDNFEVPDYIPNQMLLEEIMNTALSLKAAQNPENQRDIDKLIQLYEITMKKNIDAQTNAEMAATAQITGEIQQDMSDPNGIINSQVNAALQNVDAQTNNMQGDE